jgi:hypothetical protein
MDDSDEAIVGVANSMWISSSAEAYEKAPYLQNPPLL